VLEALVRGERPRIAGEHWDTEDDSDRPDWRTPREQVGPVKDEERILWTVLDRWNLADVDGWVHLLADSSEDAAGRATAERLRPRLRAFAESPVREILSEATEVNRSVEFIADLGPVLGLPGPFRIRGVIDFLFRDEAGWHILAVDSGHALQDDPWRGRRPGLVLQAWAFFKQTGAWPITIALYDLATGQPVRTDPQRFPVFTVAEQIRQTALRADANRPGQESSP
jgi:hypothetical protein